MEVFYLFFLFFSHYHQIFPVHFPSVYVIPQTGCTTFHFTGITFHDIREHSCPGLALLQRHGHSLKSFDDVIEAPEERIQEAAALHKFAVAAYTVWH